MKRPPDYHHHPDAAKRHAQKAANAAGKPKSVVWCAAGYCVRSPERAAAWIDGAERTGQRPVHVVATVEPESVTA